MKTFVGHIPIILFMASFLLTTGCRKGDIIISGTSTIRDDGSGTGTVTWTRDRDWLLDGFVFVNDGQVLTIEAGTVIHARTGQGEKASALIVARGGKIIAEGTKDSPIIFTVEGDDLQGSVPSFSRGLWGGLILLGNARLNTTSGEAFIEGIPLTEPRGVFGGDNDDDDSGILKYVSIRHGGTNIGSGNEINGLTLGGVGRKTVIDYVEVISNYDDGFEFFGGSVNATHLISAFCLDDAFDFDMGYSGKGQFWLAIQDPAVGDCIGEHTGGLAPVTALPYTIPVITNLTAVGRGPGHQSPLITFTDNGAGVYLNSIFLNQDNGVFTEYTGTFQDSYIQYTIGNLKITNNIFWEVGQNIADSVFHTLPTPGTDHFLADSLWRRHFHDGNNMIRNPGIIVTGNEYSLFPIIDTHENMAPYPDSWFEDVNYKGAFGNTDWTQGWSFLSREGFIR